MASQDSQPFRWHYTEFDDRNFQIRGQTLFFVVIIFSVVFIITLIYLYARWIYRFRAASASTSSADPPPPSSQTLGLDIAAINSLPIILIQSPATFTAAIEEIECCICLGAFRDGEKMKMLPNCRHCYHSECVDQWLSSRSSCPLCRASLQSHTPPNNQVRI